MAFLAFIVSALKKFHFVIGQIKVYQGLIQEMAILRLQKAGIHVHEKSMEKIVEDHPARG